MRQLNMESVTKRYNNIMYDLVLDHLTIGTTGTETKDWNLRDVVVECDYQYNLHYEYGSRPEEMRRSDCEDDRKRWRSEVGKLSRFIATYSPYISEMQCVQGHCSQYDC